VVKPTPPPAGLEWLIDAHGCRPAALRDPAVLRGLCDRVVRELELRVVGEPSWHQFPDPGGVTGMFLLTESHLTVHTFPERGLATFNLYCCRPRRPWPWRERLAEALGAADVSVRELPRGWEDRP
jgi:S-adenosylmethionine decarboxylase